MSSLAIKKTNTFAPKRDAWYGNFFSSKEVRSHAVLLGVLSPVVFAAGFLMVLTAIVAGASASASANAYQPRAAIAADMPSQPAAPATISPLIAGVDAATHFYHVPGAYVDTSTVVPALEAPQAVLIKEDLAYVWNKTFGLGGEIFVASVYEFGHEGKSALNDEVNIKAAWSQYIDGLSTLLEPQVSD